MLRAFTCVPAASGPHSGASHRMSRHRSRYGSEFADLLDDRRRHNLCTLACRVMDGWLKVLVFLRAALDTPLQ